MPEILTLYAVFGIIYLIYPTKPKEGGDGLKQELRTAETRNKPVAKNAESEKRKIKKMLEQKCREILTVAGNSAKSNYADYIVVCDKKDENDIKSELLDNGYSSDNEQAFTCEKDGKISTIFVTEKNDKLYYMLTGFSEYITQSEKQTKKYLYLKSRLYQTAANFAEYEKEKFSYIKHEFKSFIAWHFLGKKVNVSEIAEDTDCLYDYKDVSYDLNIGKSDRKIFGIPVKTYVMGVKKAIRRFSGKIIAVIYENGEFAFVAAPLNKIYYEPDIDKALVSVYGDIKPEMTCLYEKSCGAVVYKRTPKGVYYLLIKNRSKNIGFPKGHVEMDETELETAYREIFEETNVKVKIDRNFRISYNYTVSFFIKKQAVYYVAEIVGGDIKVPEDEILDYSFVPFDDALQLLTYPNEKRILRSANQYINRIK